MIRREKADWERGGLDVRECGRFGDAHHGGDDDLLGHAAAASHADNHRVANLPHAARARAQKRECECEQARNSQRAAAILDKATSASHSTFLPTSVITPLHSLPCHISIEFAASRHRKKAHCDVGHFRLVLILSNQNQQIVCGQRLFSIAIDLSQKLTADAKIATRTAS